MAEVVRAARKRDFLRDRIIQLTFGTFVATFTYAMILQRSVRGTTGGQHPAGQRDSQARHGHAHGSGGGRCSVLLAALGSCHARPRARTWMGSLANLGIAPVAWPTEEVS
jgi:Predicted membrane protein (DUF2254)